MEQEAPVVNQAAIDLLTSWLEDDDEESIAEQRESLEDLMRGLDADRLPDCKLFGEFNGTPGHRSIGNDDEPERVAAERSPQLIGGRGAETMAQAKPRLAGPHSNANSVVDAGQDDAPVVNQALLDLLTSWIEDDDEESIAEQRETWEYLKRVLDEDRLSDRKLFP